jgi:hypothetical protein
MPIEPIPQEELDRYQADRLAEAIAETPPIANIEAVTTLHDDGEVVYRGWRFRVPPIPFRQAIRLEALNADLQRLGMVRPPDDLLYRAIVVTLTRMADVMWAMIRPPWWWRFRHGRKNPLLDAERSELEALGAFFWRARTRSLVATRASVRAPRWSQPIPGSPWPRSLGPTRSGLPPLATLAATDTTGLDWPLSTWTAWQTRGSRSP